MKQDSNFNEIKYSYLKDYIEGEPSKEKKKQVISWFENLDQQFKLEQCLKEFWKETDPEKVSPLTSHDVILDRIHHKINLLHSRKDTFKSPGQTIPVLRLNTLLKNLYRVAAILLLPIIAYLGWEIVDQKMWKNSQAEVVYNEFFCPMGARSRFELPDGTSGWLNNGSRLKYPVKFPNDSREVELIGEAYFNVSHQKNRPFIINTDGLDVKVLGTKLNVQVYPDDQTQAFTLEEGSIELINRNGGEEITVLKMIPGQHAVYIPTVDQLDMTHEDQAIDPQDTIVVSDSAAAPERIDALGGKINIGFEETSQYTEWKNGKLVLRNDPMPVMLKRIERWYNVKFNITDDRINQYRYWATFEEENLDQVLKMLSLTGPVTFKKKSREQLDDGTFKTQEIDIILKN
jgi:transmembrane sensor